MIEIIWDEAFKKIYKKRIRYNQNLKRKFWDSMKSFSMNPYSRELRTHKLTGKLQDLWAFSVDYDCRVIFRFSGEQKIILIDIGTHDEVY